jgi:hypothetical protein
MFLDSLTEYILQAKSKYGFDDVSAAMRDKHEEFISLEPTWRSTMAALKILRFISDTQLHWSQQRRDILVFLKACLSQEYYSASRGWDGR